MRLLEWLDEVAEKILFRPGGQKDMEEVVRLTYLVRNLGVLMQHDFSDLERLLSRYSIRIG